MSKSKILQVKTLILIIKQWIQKMYIKVVKEPKIIYLLIALVCEGGNLTSTQKQRNI